MKNAQERMVFITLAYYVQEDGHADLFRIYSPAFSPQQVASALDMAAKVAEEGAKASSPIALGGKRNG